ncbi:MAG: Uma2 family endonuclease [Chloroflexi bacterium]|nr:Uma2 family endonuclease [Chloroflexota bacterium]
MVVGEKLITAEEFFEIVQRPENEGRRLELVDGVIVEDMAGGASGEHGETVGNFHGYIWNFVREHRLGRVTAAETCFRLAEDESGRPIVRCPDVGFITFEKAPEPLKSGLVPFAPDLAVEVISPGNTADEMHMRVLDLLRYGTRMIWIAYPTTRTVVVHTSAGAHTLEADALLDGGDVLPGFSMPVSAFFPPAAPPKATA